MARLESEGKGGYYPTPPEEMEYILKRLNVSENESITLLDPCAGKGHAIKQMADNLAQKGADVTTYGIEIEKSRAKEAKKYVDHLLNCSYDEARMSHECFSLMYLNPPFMEMNGERMELTFLRNLTQERLTTGGLLIFNLPQYVLKDCASILASRFQDIQVYRFSDENYDNYKQIIVFGVRRRRGLKTREEREYQLMMETKLKNLSIAGKDAFPSLDSPDWETVQFQLKKPSKDVDTFISTKVTLDDILRSMQNNTSFKEKVENKITDFVFIDNDKKELVPAMPPKTTHLAAVIASGHLPNQMGADHLLVGVTKRVKEEKRVTDERSGKDKDVTTFKSKSIMRIFSERGIFNLK